MQYLHRFTKKKSPLHAQASLFLSNQDDVEALVAMVTSLHEGEITIAKFCVCRASN